MSERTPYEKEISKLLGNTQLALWKKLIFALEFRYGKVGLVRYNKVAKHYEHVFTSGKEELCAVCTGSNRLSFRINLSESEKKEFEMHRNTFSENIRTAYDSLTPVGNDDGCAEASVDSQGKLSGLVKLVSLKNFEDKSLYGKVRKVVRFFLNPHFLLCFGIGWMITNGWAYIFAFLGTLFRINWMIAVGYGYLAFLWIPISPEKIVTIAIAIVLLRLLFPKDEETLGILKNMHNKVKEAAKNKKKKKKGDNTDSDSKS